MNTDIAHSEGEREWSDERSGALNENAVKNFGPRTTEKFERSSKAYTQSVL